MKIKSITYKTGSAVVCDCYAGNGYVKRHHGSLPDIDSDFNADRRDEVKQYLERRYNKNGMQRVFSAGTFTTEKIRSVIKDVARTHKIPQSTTNYITAILDEKLSWTGLMKAAATDKRVRDFIQKHPDVFEEILPIMGQPRAAGIHASAIIITPEIVKGRKVECFDLLPVKKMGDLLVSEISGVGIDEIGILKNDVLGVKELTRLSDMLDLIERGYDVKYTILQIASKYLNDEKAFRILRDGNTQGLFQMSGEGITRFIKRLKPDNINDIIALVAIYRPGPLSSGATDNYVRAKNGEYDPEYLWGTYDILNTTFGELIYQEDISRVTQKVGMLGVSDSVNLVKALSKKKIEKVRKFKEKFFNGAKKNGCPIDAAEKIWSNVEDAAKYSFNKSHATAYGLTAYVGAWLKAHYPTVFYTVVLRDQDEEKMPILISEIKNMEGTELKSPDINISDENFTADMKANKIYWSFSRVKYLGPKAVKYIVQDRKIYGRYDGLEDFIRRIFRAKFKDFNDEGDNDVRERCPVTARGLKNLIFAGAFDDVEKVGSVIERYGLLEKSASLLGFKLTETDVPEDMKDKHYYWSMKQIAVSSHGAIDYERIINNLEPSSSLKTNRYVDFRNMNDLVCELRKGIVCATIISVSDKSYKDKKTGEKKHFGKIELQQNTETNILTVWDDWRSIRKEIEKAVGGIIVTVANIKWSDYDEKNVFQINKVSYLKIL